MDKNNVIELERRVIGFDPLNMGDFLAALQ